MIASNSVKMTANFARKLVNQLGAIFLILLSLNSQAQVAINETNAAANAGSELDISSTSKGVLFPIMTQVQRDAVPGPAAGLIIFNITGGYHNYYNGTNWVQINRTTALVPATNPAGAGTDVGVGVGVADPDNSAILHVNSTTKGFLLPRISGVPASPVAGMIYYNTGSNQVFFYNTAWDQLTFTVSTAGAGGSSTAAGVLIGTGTITASAKMEVKTTSKGLLIPRMTTAERDLIVSPAEGLTIYNSTDAKIQYFLGNAWYNWSSASNNYGQVVGNPGLSCKDIYNNNPGTNGVDGTYYINPNGITYACTCDMTRDGGGWTLVENTGPKGTANNIVATSGSAAPISSSNSGAFAKLSDTDINLIRGGASGYATSILKVERQNSCAANKSIYFKQNKVLISNGSAAQAINSFHLNYANAVANTGLVTSGASYAGAFDSWGGTAGYQIIFNYSTEGFITNGCNSTTGCTANNRSECNVLLWVK